MEFLGITVLWPYIQSVCWCCCYVGPVSTAFKYLCNLARTNYKLPENDAIASKHVAAV